MHERDVTRGKIKNASSVTEKSFLHSKYKALRNKVTRNIRQENVDFNYNRVNEANNESGLWKIASEVTNPKKASEWSINMAGSLTQFFNTLPLQKCSLTLFYWLQKR